MAAVRGASTCGRVAKWCGSGICPPRLATRSLICRHCHMTICRRLPSVTSSGFGVGTLPIFFGRGDDIRELYQRITTSNAAPIILYYGQSGVGKSSLLAAGLLPRLEQKQVVVYVRRDQVLGLAGTLSNSLLDQRDFVDGAAHAAAADLAASWLAVETKTGKPLTVIVDQVEETYTRPT